MKILTTLTLAALCASSFAQELGAAWLVRPGQNPTPVAFAPLGELRDLFGVKGLSATLAPVFGTFGDRAVLGGAALFRRKFAQNADLIFGPALQIEQGGRWTPGLAFGVTVRF